MASPGAQRPSWPQPPRWVSHGRRSTGRARSLDDESTSPSRATTSYDVGQRHGLATPPCRRVSCSDVDSFRLASGRCAPARVGRRRLPTSTWLAGPLLDLALRRSDRRGAAGDDTVKPDVDPGLRIEDTLRAYVYWKISCPTCERPSWAGALPRLAHVEQVLGHARRPTVVSATARDSSRPRSGDSSERRSVDDTVPMSGRPAPRAMWEERFSADHYVLRDAPSPTTSSEARCPGSRPVSRLCLAEGEGRNAVHSSPSRVSRCTAST